MDRIQEMLAEIRTLCGDEAAWDNDADVRTRARYSILLLTTVIDELLADRGEKFERALRLIKGGKS